MSRRFVWLSTGLFLLVFVPGFLSAQDDQEADSLFFRGVTLYREGQYMEAFNVLELLDRVYPNHRRTTGSILMQGKSLYKLKEYRRALAIFEKIVEEYPESQYADDGRYGMATVFYRQNLYGEAVMKLIEVIEHGNDGRLMRKAANLYLDIINGHMSDDDLRELLKKISGERGRAAVTLRLAQREIDKKQFQTVRKIVRDFLRDYPRSPYTSQMEQLLNRVERMGEGAIKVGIILPLSGPYSEQGQGLLNGIRYAVDLYNEENGPKVEIVVRDTEGRIVRAIKAAQELCKDEEIVAIIGELQSDITAAISAVAHENGVVLLAPTAMADGIASIGPTIFQINSSLSVRGEMIAEYAVSGLGLKRFAVLYPADDYGKSMTDSFIQTVNRHGGEILVEKWYFEGTKNLGPQFKAIREIGIRQMIKDSLLIIVPEEVYDELYADQPQQGEILYVKQKISSLIDSTELAITSIDGLFLPVYGGDLQYVVTQPAFYNIKTRIFGGAYWNAIDILNEQKKFIDPEYIDGVIFLSNYYVDPSNYRYYRFRDTYRERTSSTPGKMEICGYDTAKLLLEVVGEKSLLREQVSDRLVEVRHFSGIGGTISFNEDRINNSLHLLQYRGDKIIQIR